MKEMKRGEIQRGYTLIRVLGVTLLALLMLVSTAGAEPYTYIIRDDATGGDSALIGVWDPITKTCTLTKDVYGAIQIDSSGITLDGSGYSVLGTGTGIGICLPQFLTNITIKDVTITNFDIGIIFWPDCSSHSIIGCNISNNKIGVELSDHYCNDNIIKSNSIKSNSVGIKMFGGDHNIICDNNISGNEDGIETMFGCRNSLISGNNISSNSGNGIFASEFTYNNISDNTISNNTNGIYLRWDAGFNYISKNTISKCGTGVIFGDSTSGNNIFDNIIKENQLGIKFWSSSDRTDIYNNCLSKNVVNAESDGDNNFYSNYYSDYTGSEADSDGIGDTPYNILGGAVDNSPLMKCPFLKQPILPIANFSSNITQGYAPLSVQFTYLSDNATEWSWDFGDGATSISQNSKHTYSTAGVYTVNLTVSNTNSTDSKTAIINVLIPAPTINSIAVPLDPIPVGTSITTTADVAYIGDLSTLTAEWNWGDESTSEIQVSSNFETSHVYNSPGVYSVTFTITDAESRSETKKALDYVVVYDPHGGFVTGGGWINSPAGAYVPDKTLAGKATFGFVSKYEKGATVPNGKTEFQFNVGNLNFCSENYDWLVVADSKAKYKGTGTINGEGNYGFMVSVVDGAVDKFRMKIWEKESGNTIYDNEMGTGEDLAPSTAISGGSTIVHKKK